MKSRVFILEDEPLIALELEQLLSDAGYEIAGVAASVEKATQLLSTLQCDLAVLDANVKGKKSNGVANILVSMNVPFLYLTGYGRESLADDFASATILSKPIRENELLAALEQLRRRGHDGNSATPPPSDAAT